MSYFEYGNNKIYYEVIGEGQPLLMLHGNTVSSRIFFPVIPLFSKQYKVITMDFLGNGKSDRIEKWPEDLWYQWGEQAIALCDYLNLKDVNIIGTSGGALAAINIALSHPDRVNAAVADSFEGINADPILTQQIRDGRNYTKQSEEFCSMLKMMHGDDWESVLEADTQAVIDHAEHIGSFFHRNLAELACRLLLTGSAEDEMFPQGHYNRLFEGICTETQYASAHIFEHGGHPAMMSNMNDFVILCKNFFS